MRRIAPILTAAVLVSTAARAVVMMSAPLGGGAIVPDGASSGTGFTIQLKPSGTATGTLTLTKTH